MKALLVFFIFLVTQADTVPVRSLIEDETILPINLSENNVIPLLSGDPIQLKSTSDELSTTILFVQTSNLPRAQRQILFNRNSQGKICVLKKDHNKEDAIKSALTARRNNAVIFKSEKNNLDKFAVEFKFSKIPAPTLSLIISCDNESCPSDILSFVREYTTWRLSGGQKTLIGLGAIGLIATFILVENRPKRFLIKHGKTAIRRAKAQANKIFKVSQDVSLTENIKKAFALRGAKKEFLTASDLWGNYRNLWTEDFIRAHGERWIKGTSKTAILILTMAEIQHPEIMNFLEVNKNIAHTEERSIGSLSTGTGYGSDYQNHGVFNGKKRQSIKAGNRILLINDDSVKCPAEYSDKSAITWDGKMYGQIDSRSPDEIIADLESYVWSNRFVQINKFFDLEISL